ncbi:MAG TPA: PLP-dependent aspartate aminotransferase family protein [Pyrinomonadaceae bacterium]|jgi:cystathionine gamma-synthase/methionine-gamma-lyase
MPEDKRGLDFRTRAVHAGERGSQPKGQPVAAPVYPSTTFTYDSMAEMDAVFAGEREGYVYTRHGNPTVDALSDAVNTLEEGAGACAYASGMAALHAALFACDLPPGSTVLASQDLYGATAGLLSKVFGVFGVQTIQTDFFNLDKLQTRARELRPRVLVAETISNPLLKVCDIDACAEVARSVGARLVIDNTFATPYLCQPVRHGADFVVHSATKYLGGHGDVTGGVTVVADSADMPALVAAMKLVGGILGVWEAHQILRGMKTLVLRMERQCANARELAEKLSGHPRIARVLYPSLDAGDAAEEICRRMLRAPHAGALVTVALADDTREAAFRFMDALRLCVRSTSLGDVYSAVLHPATASHRDFSPARRRELGIGDGIVRVSVGIEELTDIYDDIRQALEA